MVYHYTFSLPLPLDSLPLLPCDLLERVELVIVLFKVGEDEVQVLLGNIDIGMAEELGQPEEEVVDHDPGTVLGKGRLFQIRLFQQDFQLLVGIDLLQRLLRFGQEDLEPINIKMVHAVVIEGADDLGIGLDGGAGDLLFLAVENVLLEQRRSEGGDIILSVMEFEEDGHLGLIVSTV